MVSTTIHEMVHVKQYVFCELRDVSAKANGWKSQLVSCDVKYEDRGRKRHTDYRKNCWCSVLLRQSFKLTLTKTDFTITQEFSYDRHICDPPR